jgi:hypothetical protein
MRPTTRALTFGGELLQRGFWLYVWKVTTPEQAHLYYVGRTGDSSSSNAQSPFNRMGQHLGFNDKSNVLRRQLVSKGVAPESCSFALVTHGPILAESKGEAQHRNRRDTVAALEKGLADAMSDVGYEVMNTVHCRKPIDAELFAEVHAAFAAHFPALQAPRDAG